MEKASNFSQKKKNDLIEIAKTFGVLSENDAKKMSKDELIRFLEMKNGHEVSQDPGDKPVRKKREKKKQGEATAQLSIEEALAAETVKDLPVEEQTLSLPGKARAAKQVARTNNRKKTSPASAVAKAESSSKKEAAAAEPVSAKKKENIEEQETPVLPEGKGRGRPGRPAKKQTKSISKDEGKEKSGRTKKQGKDSQNDVGRGQEKPTVQTRKNAEKAGTSEEKTESTAVKSSIPAKKNAVSSRHKGRSMTIEPHGANAGNRRGKDSQSSSRSTSIPLEKSAEEPGKSQAVAEVAENIKKELVPQEIASGVLEINQDGTYGFLRRTNYLQGHNDLFISTQFIRRYGLRNGDYVTGPIREKRDTDRYQAIQYISKVNDMPPEAMQNRAYFDRLTAIYPDDRFNLEIGRNELSTRIIDLIAPIGKGQRGMIVSPPKAGKTILLQKIANSIHANNPAAKLIVLLIDERPEEVTDMQRSINGEVVYSTFDKTPENHVRIVELVLERAMRLVELGQDVVILLDSITRLGRAYNLTINPTGRTLSGGLDPGALYGPKRFFGAARNIENGGSLTIIATALIDTGSRMDEVIFEEFKGTGNMEVYLDRKLSEKRIFPAIDITRSGTRREDLLLSSTELDAVWAIRKAFSQLDTTQVTEMIISLLLKTKSNSQFVQSVNVSFNDKEVFEAMRGLSKQGNSAAGNGAGYQRQEMR